MDSEEAVVAELECLGHPLRLEARWQGADLAVRLYGGSRPHIGSVVLAVPRPSLRDPSKTSATASVLNRPGHQDEWPARRLAESLASRLRTNVAVFCGIHYDGLDDDRIEELKRRCEALAEEVLPALEAQARDRPPAEDL
ncbi:MAG: proteasome assembly chaperone 4 family protein [Nitrospinota bacterium]